MKKIMYYCALAVLLFVILLLGAFIFSGFTNYGVFGKFLIAGILLGLFKWLMPYVRKFILGESEEEKGAKKRRIPQRVYEQGDEVLLVDDNSNVIKGKVMQIKSDGELGVETPTSIGGRNCNFYSPEELNKMEALAIEKNQKKYVPGDEVQLMDDNGNVIIGKITQVSARGTSSVETEKNINGRTINYFTQKQLNELEAHAIAKKEEESLAEANTLNVM